MMYYCILRIYFRNCFRNCEYDVIYLYFVEYKCKVGQFQCVNLNKIYCVDSNVFCDGMRDCINGEDELNCSKKIIYDVFSIINIFIFYI